ncbi:MAG: anaerobic ribonucleoside-triphosphate reductase [Clostridia bacterium]|nr:anaerobic ribonucleoside-triphosphate reductase [Bacilli bacterium]MBR3511557.1 anaerobic ribonucleoside-triphosphate reductase [Clostridia bacterium]
MKIVKRDGHIVDYDSSKIETAIGKANNEVQPSERATDDEIKGIIQYIEDLGKKRILVEDIQDIIEEKLMELNRFKLAKKYITYRYTRELVRKANTTDQTIKELIEGQNEYWNSENSSKNSTLVTRQRDYLAGITSTDITRRYLLTEDIVKAHDEGIIHFHDTDYFAQNALHNCELINLEDMLQNGTVINGVMIEKPHRFLTAATIATQIILAVTSASYGGATITLTHLAPFVRSSYERYFKKYQDRNLNKEDAEKYAWEDTRKEINDAVQTFNYQVNSMTNTNAKSPFLTVFMYLGETEQYKVELAMIIEEFLKQRIHGFKNENGVYITAAFPKLLYVLEEDTINEDGKYFYLTKLAAECTAKRMVPDYISEKMMKEYKKNIKDEETCYPCMGASSFLTPDRTMSIGNIAHAMNYVDGKGKYYGRFNQGVVTLNLPDVALTSKKDMDKFWEILDERIELCHKALQIRHKRLSTAISDVAPILWQHGALARLKPGETIHELLHHGYSTLSLGYAGLYECVKYMTDHSHTDGAEGKEFASKIMQRLIDACEKWKEAEDIDYTVYGTPIETTAYKFAKCLKERFGIVKGITDRNYITNSCEVPVFEKIDGYEKLKLESEFQMLSSGGAIAYVETPNLQDNLDKVLEIMKYIYDNVMYAEINTKADYCQKCEFSGEMLINDNYEWYCPECGNKDPKTLNVARRICGYIESDYFSKERTQDIKDRVVHIKNK